ncbi:TcpQ domain-containing protein [Castellaniella hirudinis]|uniref:TcpQ domain-containing protein n=1 Tax=Castellaniella hirudinis TaxID=1144617 RepID=UPI0039C41F77
MVKFIWAACAAATISGCAAIDGEHWWRQIAGRAPAVATYHFDWQLSGDPDPAPLQIFDDGRDTWLQYPAGQAVPALFARSAGGDRLLHARRVGDFLVVSGVPGHLLMRGGLLQAEARRLPLAAADRAGAAAGAAPALPSPAGPAVPSEGITVLPEAAAVPVTLSPSASASTAASRSAPASTLLSAPAPAPALVSAPTPASASGLPPRVASAEVAVAGRAAVTPGRPPTSSGVRRPPSGAASKPPAPVFEVTPADGNVRRALGRWAGAAGWTFEAEHWAVDVDIPLAGSAAFDEPFRAAVRSLLAATELGDRPVQPCFYANRVLRVVPLAQRCDRTQEPGAAS